MKLLQIWKGINCEYLRISNELFGKLSTPSRLFSLLLLHLKRFKLFTVLWQTTLGVVFTLLLFYPQMHPQDSSWDSNLIVALASASKALCFVILHFYRFFAVKFRQNHPSDSTSYGLMIFGQVFCVLILPCRGYCFLLIITWILPSFIICTEKISILN